MILYIVSGVFGFVLGIIARSHVGELTNLTKEEYIHCVQIVMNDYDKNKGDAQRLLLEIQNYATNEQMYASDLSHEASEIVAKVQSIK
jgi:hypothetical protein